MANKITAEQAAQIANSNELPTILNNILALATQGGHRHIVKELSAESAAELAKLGYHVETFVSVDGTRFEIKW